MDHHDDDLGDDDTSQGAASWHPPVLCSLIIIRNRPEYFPNSVIAGYALFTVTKVSTRQASFDLVHRGFYRDASRAKIIDGLADLMPSGAEVLIRQPPLSFPGHMRKFIADPNTLPPNDAQLILRRGRELKLLPFAISDEHLIYEGTELGLSMTVPASSPVGRTLRASSEAMALWSIYVSAFCPPAEARALIAAFHAWQAIERAKPNGF